MKIYVLVGPIASGKSSYCKNAAKSGQIILNDDSIVNLVHADEYQLYNEKLKILYKTLENDIVSVGLAMGRSVVVDRGVNVSVSGRKRWIALANSFDVPCEAISFINEGPEVHAKRRAESDGRGHDYDYWLQVANIHNSKYALPTLAEGFSNIHYIYFEDVKNGVVIL